jgi:hypothetical protein
MDEIKYPILKIDLRSTAKESLKIMKAMLKKDVRFKFGSMEKVFCRQKEETWVTL